MNQQEQMRKLIDTLKEAWGKPTVVSPEEKGKYHGKSKAELLSAYNRLKKSGPHHKGSPEYGRMRELAFAIRAKGNWGKVSEHHDMPLISKEECEYTDHSTNENECEHCKHFVQPNRCEIVEGTINPEGWCKFYSR